MNSITICKWCGTFFKDVKELQTHEDIHRQMDSLGGFMNANTQEEANTHSNEIPQEKKKHEVNTKLKTTRFRCDQCNKMYHLKKDLNRHCRAEHSGKTLSCCKCQKVFKYPNSKTHHEKTCNGEREHLCSKCGKKCTTAHGLKRHMQWHNQHAQSISKRTSSAKPGNPSKAKSTHTKPVGNSNQFQCRQCNATFNSGRNLQYHAMHQHRRSRGVVMTRPRDSSPLQCQCRRCFQRFDTRRELYLHNMRQHYQVGGALQRRPWDNNNAPWERDGESAGLREVYEANSPLILEAHRRGPIMSVYNFPLDNEVRIDQLMRYANEIYGQEQRAFRLNLVFGVILQHRETGDYRYFVPYNNNGIFERPMYISRPRDLDNLRQELQRRDILTDILRIRPDTKYIPVLVTNVHFTVYSTFYPLGNGVLPDYLLKKDSIYPLIKNQHNGRLYKDHLCAFRCLALHRGHQIKSIEGPAKEFHSEWLKHPHSSTEGLTFEDIPAFEELFCVNLEVYSLQEDDFATLVYHSTGLQESTMYLNMYQNHLSYIRDFNLYAQKYRCRTCDRHFKTSQLLHRHQKICTNKTRYIYPGGFYKSRDSIFEELDQYGIHVPIDQRTYPWFVCYDFEAMLQKVNDRPTDFLQWTQKHVPISVSICSNVEGHTEPLCIIESDQDLLVQKMIEAMKHVANIAYDLAEEKWGWVLEAIDEKVNQDLEEEEQLAEEEDDDDDHDENDEEEKNKRPSHPLKTLYGYLLGYMTQLPIIGFNSAKYDLNLVRKYIAKHLEMQYSKHAFVIKKNNAYACMATDELKFLDMSQFLAAGSSYAGFLKAYHVTQKKGFFPYEWFDEVEKLEWTTLPTHEAFFSTLKSSNISKEDYEFCQRVWREKSMNKFQDFLVWYNNLDVGPFVEAVERFQKFYFDKGIDVFKTAISVPGIARQLLFKSARQQNANFSLFDKDNADLYQTIKHNIVGGPSIIFTRHHKAGQTRIRGGKLCKSVLGFDANALYLEAIGKPMPVGAFVRRRLENDFRPEVRDKYMSAYYWMNWLIHTRGSNIRHKLNYGQEVRIGKYPVDGYSPPRSPGDKPIVYQFHGCYFHSHLCDVTRGVKSDKWWKHREENYQRTLAISAYLRARGCEVIEMWECQYREYCRSNPGIYTFINQQRPGFFQRHKGKTTQDQILEGVVKGELFGMVEVDIQVPEQWPWYFKDPRMTPHQYFEEMSPLFCTTDIPFDAVGEHMQAHIREYKLSEQPRRLLVGGMKARQLLIATPLLQWYIRHGMVVTKVYQVVEFQQQRCFKDFVKEVSDARREGDRDPDTAIIADTQKVIGNSGYGSLIMDQTRHRNVKYVQGENETCLKINDPCFCKLECLDPEEQYYEVELAKRVIKLDLPIQLGYFILQYAKLRMLEFYYDFMDLYVDRSSFEYCEMDTDSAYMAISGSCLEDVIKPEMLEQYRHGLRGFCTNTDIEADAQHHWFPRTCCSSHAKFDRRTPGMFKLEYCGDEMIGLCSKTYIVRKEQKVSASSTRIRAYHLLRRCLKLKKKPCPYRSRRVNEFKFSSKGVSKRHLKAPMSKFRRVLKTGKAQSGLNRGFRVRNNTVFTYSQERRGFSYLYCKRKVTDGIHTVPLDITLCPVPPKQKENQEVNDQELVDILTDLLEDSE